MFRSDRAGERWQTGRAARENWSVISGAVIGRDAELEFVQAFLDEVGGGPAGLVLSGEAGIGKTILWQTGVEQARGRFAHVLTCRGTEAEAGLSFAGLSELLGDVLGAALDSLLAPRRRALEVALLLTEPGQTRPDPLAIGLAVHDLLQALAQQGPLVVAVDDVQWLDAASAGALEVALRRLSEDRIGVLVASRQIAAATTPLGLERSLPRTRLTVLPVGPLSLGSLHHLLDERLGLRLSRPELGRVQEASGGNPYFALELGRELVRTQARRSAGGNLRVPESLRELLGGRLAQLPAETADVLLKISVLARPTVELVAAAHGDVERVRDAISVGGREEILVLDDSRVRFAHPLLASICYERAPVWKRRTAHRAVAAVVTDIEERARHLALAAEGPDGSIAHALDGAAQQAAARGSTAAAAELSELAAQLTPDDPALARQRRFRAAGFHRLAGDVARAQTMLEQLIGEVSPGAERADVLFELAHSAMGNPPAFASLYDRAWADVEHDDARSARWLAFRAWARLLESDNVRALADARAALERAERVGDPELVATVIARLGQIEMWAGEVTPGLLERGAALALSEGLPPDYWTNPRFWLARLRIRQGRLEEARAMFAVLEDETVARGDEQTRTHVLWYRSILEWFAGNWQFALELASEACGLGEQMRFASNGGWKGRVKALIEADLGLVKEARASAAEGLAEMQQGSRNEVFSLLCVGVLGRLELALGNVQEAGSYLSELPARLISSGLNDPTQPIWADAIETLVALGEVEQARVYLDTYEQNSRRVKSGWAVACAARCRGQLAAAQGDVAAAFDAFDASLVELDRTPYVFERGRTLLGLGVVRRQAMQKRSARAALQQALAIFEQLGARLWAEKARAELARISGRRAEGDELTGTEARVAELAAAGRSNKEIAAELFMGVSTVESHLSRVYRKLGVRSRAGLGSRLETAAKAADGPAQS
jgi:DNA-binding CsgD family transcriptional regulator